MPGTYRYSATFDKPYVEDTSPPPRSPVRFSIGSWQGSNATSGGGEGNEHPVVVAPSTLHPNDVDLASPTSSVVSPEEEPGQNPPLNDTYRHHARSASTDSLDSASCGSVSGSSAASSSGGSGGHSRQVSIEGSEFISSRLSCGKMPVAAAVSHNPLQFVKVGPVPLYKKAEEQIKIAKEKKICREAIKENEEAWQSNLDSWKNRRRKVSEKSLARLEEMKMLDEQEKHAKTNNSRVKTFSEMMEERAQKPRSYNLAIYVNNSEEDLMSPDNGSHNSSSERINENRTNLKARSSYSVDLENRENDFHNSSFKVLEHETNGVESKVHSKHSRNILSSESNQRQRKNTDGCAASVDDGFAEEEGTTYGLYTGDSGLESFGSSQRVGDLADSSSELSTDSGSVYDRVGTEDETGSATPLGQLTTGTDLLEEFSSGKRTKSWPSNLEQKDGYIQRSMRIWVNPQHKEKDFGFTIKVDKDGQGGGAAMVDTIKTGSLSHEAGLRKGDEILSVNGDLAPGRSHSSLMFSIKQSVYRGQLDLIISRPESEELNGAENDIEESESRCRPRSHVGPAQRRLLNNRSFDDSCPSRSASENGYRARSKSESSRNRCSWLEREKSASLDDEFPVMNEDLADSKHSKRDSDKSKKPPIAPKVAVKKSPPPVPAKPKFTSAMLNGHRDIYIIATSAQTVEGKLPIDSPVVESKQLSELSRSDSNYAVEKSNILDDMVQSESEDAAFHSVTPLLITLSDGLRDSTESPNFVPKPDNDVCFSDFNESEQDTEKEIDQDICVKEEGIWNQQSNRAYNGESTKRNSQISVVEEQIAKEEVPVDKDNSTDFEIFQNSSDVSFSTSDMSNERYFIPLNPLYQDTDGFNIVYQSHQEEEGQNESLDDQERSSSMDDISSAEPFIQCAMNDETRGSQESIEEVHEVIQRESVESDGDLYFEIDNTVGSIEAQIDAVISKENYNALQMSGDSNSEGSPFYMDETALASFDERNMRAPPSEKPPPPPPMDGESPEKVDENVVVRRNNTFKRIKKEIWRRRSDFLGIDPADDEIDIDVPPPPDLSEILKSERDLERKNRLFLEEERSNIQYNLGNMDELSLREIEILHKLEKEEKIKSLKVERDDHELVTTESSTLAVKPEDDERIKRLQDERRRMSEERILREEERISMEEDRMFREREEKLRLKEEHAGFDRNSDTGSESKQLIEQNVSVETSLPSTINNQIDVTSNSTITNSVSVPLTSDTISATVDIAVKEALRIERDRLRLEQEALQREREEYRRHIELEQQRRYESSQSDSSSEKSMSPQREREAVIWASKQPHGFQEDQSDLEFPDVVLRSKSNEAVDELSPSGQPLNKDTLHFLGAAPKARIIQNEQWINHNEKVAKRRSEPSMSRESRYNQNHWLLHEAEMRRISEQNERQRLQQSPDRPASYHNSVPQYKSPSTTNGVTEPPTARREVPFSRIPSTAPRPYQRPAPPPVPQNKPARVVQKEPWNYRSVTAPTNFTPKKDGSPPKQLPSPGEYRNYPVETSTHQRNVTPQTVTEIQPQEQFLSVSGKEKCSHCAEHLGHGGAMIIESLQLCYHMHCFCCCVCGAQLGNGMCGTDVRVRSNKLHCQNCYSNDEAGLKFSQV